MGHGSPARSNASGGTDAEPEGTASAVRGGYSYTPLPPSPEGQLLRSRVHIPVMEAALADSTSARDGARRHAVVVHFVRALPRKMVRRIASGGAPREVASTPYTSLINMAVASLSRPKVCGRKGEAIAGHKRVLAALADFVAHTSGAGGVSVADRLTTAVAARFVESEWTRGAVFQKKSLGEAAHKSLVWLAEHAGLDCEKSSLAKDVVRAWAVPARLESDEAPSKKQAGPLPLRLLAGLEGLLNAVPDPTPMYSEGLLTYAASFVIGTHGGLRAIELESARLSDARADASYIDVTFAPKGDPSVPRAQLRLRPSGVMGPFRWWPGYRAKMAGAPTLLPQLSGGSTLATSTGLIMIAHRDTGGARKLLVECITTPAWGVPAEAVARLRLTAHSMHDTLPHTFLEFAAEPALSMGDAIAGALACGNWSSSPSLAAVQGKAPAGARSAEQRAAIPALYASAVGDETNRTATLNASLAARWSVVSLAWAFLIAPGAPAFTTLDPLDGWMLVRGWGLAYAHLGGRVPLPPIEDAFWRGGALDSDAWKGAHALLAEWGERAAGQAHAGGGAQEPQALAAPAPPESGADAASIAW